MVQSAITGLSAGGAYAALGVCVVLLYRMVGVVNFALAAVGAVGWYVLLVLHGGGLAYGPAALVAVATGAALSIVIGAVMAQWFAEADVRTKSTVGIAMFIAVTTIAFRVFGDDPRPVPPQMSGRAFEVAGVYVTVATLVALGGSALLAAGVALYLGRTRVGQQLRAISERPMTAELMGIPVRRRTLAVWAAAGAIATLAMLVIGSQQSSSLSAMSLLIVPAFGAALFGLFRNFYATVAGGILLGVLQSMVAGSGALKPYQDAVPFVVIVIAMLWAQRREVWDVAR